MTEYYPQRYPRDDEDVPNLTEQQSRNKQKNCPILPHCPLFQFQTTPELMSGQVHVTQ